MLSVQGAGITAPYNLGYLIYKLTLVYSLDLVTGADEYFSVDLLEYCNLRLGRGGSKLFMPVRDNEELLMSVGAEQNSEIVKVVGQSTTLECSAHKAH